MDILSQKSCPKHHLQSTIICTREQCFAEKDILVCPQCSGKHSTHHTQLIQISLLTEKVQNLMKSRMDFQLQYEKSCDALITQLRKFKIFKEDLFSMLNQYERSLNNLCRKLKVSLPYEKDKNLFKNNLNYVYLSMKAHNSNRDIYFNFRKHVNDIIAQCRKCLYRYEINSSQVPLLAKYDYQICSIIKKCKQDSIDEIRYQVPNIKRFKKQIIKNKNNQAINSQLFRIGNNQFISFNPNQPFIKTYSCSNFALPRQHPLLEPVNNVTIIEKNAFMTTNNGGIFIYDLLNEKLLKQYSSSNHKHAQITNILALNNNSVINFIKCPNQIVCLQYNQQLQTLKIIKGLQTKSKCISSIKTNHNFMGCFDDKTVKIFNSQYFQKQKQYQFDYQVNLCCKINSNIISVSGQSQSISLIDLRTSGIINHIKTGALCLGLKKIHPFSIMALCFGKMKVFDVRIGKELFMTKLDDNVKFFQVLNSSCFVTSGRSIDLWKGVA